MINGQLHIQKMVGQLGSMLDESKGVMAELNQQIAESIDESELTPAQKKEKFELLKRIKECVKNQDFAQINKIIKELDVVLGKQ